MAVTSHEAARHLCRVSEWTLTNLALQKMLYLAHMSYVGVHEGMELVDEGFEAWAYGPVLPSLYRQVKTFGNGPIRDVFYHVKDISSRPEGVMLSSAWKHLKSKTASELVAMTHWANGAWAKVYTPGIYGSEIPTSLILEEYETRKKISAPSPNVS